MLTKNLDLGFFPKLCQRRTRLLPFLVFLVVLAVVIFEVFTFSNPLVDLHLISTSSNVQPKAVEDSNHALLKEFIQQSGMVRSSLPFKFDHVEVHKADKEVYHPNGDVRSSNYQDMFGPVLGNEGIDSRLLKNVALENSMRPRWPSAVDKQLSIAKSEMWNGFPVKDVNELYAAAFRNISIFTRSYELMERTLKVYVYKEGKKPIFHKPQLEGVYASEGWFMKLMEGSARFRVDDPRKAHLFYLPFSSSILRFTIAPGLHSKRKLVKYLKDYIDLITAKYPFWNRTGGADHFLTACHDWALYMTKHHMSRSIRALCNADLAEGFNLRKDVSLPTTNVRALDVAEDLGGKPARKRNLIAFFAGGSHGHLREVLLNLWTDKDPRMIFFNSTPHRSMSKPVYTKHMKNSRYCLCPRGYQSYSPRIVEAILYECVPVIIADKFVPPFFETLNWDAFSVVVEEKEIHRLKEILESISISRYLSLQKGVRMVRRHFIWNATPVKYDMFHMILHSVWFSRLTQI